MLLYITTNYRKGQQKMKKVWSITLLLLMLLLTACVLPLRAVNLCNVVGVFRGGGDVRYALLVDVGPLYCLCVTSAALCALVFGLGIEVVYVCIVFDDVAKCFLCLPHLRGGRWINSVTRA